MVVGPPDRRSVKTHCSYRVLSVVCFHTPTVRWTAHSVADGYETNYSRVGEFLCSGRIEPYCPCCPLFTWQDCDGVVEKVPKADKEEWYDFFVVMTSLSK